MTAPLPRRVLVIGGSGTLGRVIVQDLLAEAASVAFTWYLSKDRADALTAAHPGLTALQLDVTVPGAVATAVNAAADALGGLDALVHCAALAITPGQSPPAGTYQKMADLTADDFALLMQVNVQSAFLAAQAAVPHMTDGGNIVLLGSVDSVKPVPSPVHYAASKAALTGLARAMAKELGRANVRVNVIAPAILEAGMSEIVPDDTVQQFLKHSGFGRRGTLKEAAAVVAWFAVHNTYVTAQTVALDGGL